METVNFDLIAARLNEPSLLLTTDPPFTYKPTNKAGKILLKWN